MRLVPTFNSTFSVIAKAPDCVFLLSEQQVRLLRGRSWYLVCEQIDGHRTVDEILERLSGNLATHEILYVISLLEHKGYVCNQPHFHEAFYTCFSSLNTDPTSAAKRLNSTAVTVKHLGAHVVTEELTHALESLSIRVQDDAEIVIVLTDDYLRKELREINRQFLASSQKWILANVAGPTIWLGPLFAPAVTACWECLAQRLHGHRLLEEVLRQQPDTVLLSASRHPVLPTRLEAACNALATEVARFVVQEDSTLASNILTIDFGDWNFKTHRVVKRPQCPVCGDIEDISRRFASEIELSPQTAAFDTGTGFRTCTSEVTLNRLIHHVSPITGVVRTLERAKDPAAETYVYSAGLNFLSHASLEFLLNPPATAYSAGKGTTDIQARASAVCEALERYSGSFEGYESVKKASYESIASVAIHPNDVMNFSTRQFQHRQEWNATHQSIQRIPEPLPDEVEIHWSPIWSLTKREVKFLPAALCYYDFPVTAERRYCFADSNGMSAGNCLEEAIVQGFLELIERDAVALWWYNKVRRPAVNLARMSHPFVGRMATFQRSIGRQLWVLDVTSDFAIPTFVAVSSVEARREFTLGFGCHFDPVVAIIRALTEMSQKFPAGPGTWPAGAEYSSHAALDLSFLSPHAHEDLRPKTEYNTENLNETISLCVELASTRGMDLYVMNLTRPDIGLNVARVVVPGLRHFWTRLGPGRLYEVPPKLGWLNQELTESELNSIPLLG